MGGAGRCRGCVGPAGATNVPVAFGVCALTVATAAAISNTAIRLVFMALRLVDGLERQSLEAGLPDSLNH